MYPKKVIAKHISSVRYIQAGREGKKGSRNEGNSGSVMVLKSDVYREASWSKCRAGMGTEQLASKRKTQKKTRNKRNSDRGKDD